MKKLIYATLCFLISTPLLANDLSPGLWELSLETKVIDSPGFSPPPFKLNQCISESDSQHPDKIIGPLSTSGANNCQYTEKSYSNNTLRFSMSCSGSFNLKSTGTVTFTSTSFDGNILVTGNINGQAIEFRNHLTAHRLGDC